MSEGLPHVTQLLCRVDCWRQLMPRTGTRHAWAFAPWPFFCAPDEDWSYNSRASPLGEHFVARSWRTTMGIAWVFSKRVDRSSLPACLQAVSSYLRLCYSTSAQKACSLLFLHDFWCIDHWLVLLNNCLQEAEAAERRLEHHGILAL